MEPGQESRVISNPYLASSIMQAYTKQSEWIQKKSEQDIESTRKVVGVQTCLVSIISPKDQPKNGENIKKYYFMQKFLIQAMPFRVNYGHLGRGRLNLWQPRETTERGSHAYARANLGRGAWGICHLPQKLGSKSSLPFNVGNYSNWHVNRFFLPMTLSL